MATEAEREGTRITIRVSTELREAIDEAAASKAWSVAHWVSRAVEQAIDDWRAANGKAPLARTVRRAPPAMKRAAARTAPHASAHTAKRVAKTCKRGHRYRGEFCSRCVRSDIATLKMEFTANELARDRGRKASFIPGAREARARLQDIENTIARREGRKPSTKLSDWISRRARAKR